MDNAEQQIKYFILNDGSAPFLEWLNKVKDFRAKAKIHARITLLKVGHLGDSKSLRKGLFELRINEGKGYRIYFTNIDNGKLLILGGNKATQIKDIKLANHYLDLYKKGN